MTDKKLSDEQYWKQYEEDFEGSGSSHPISIDVSVTFRTGMDQLIFETKERDINCNVKDLQVFFDNLKRIIRMQDEKIEQDDDFE